MLSIAIALAGLGAAFAFPADCPNVTVLHMVTRGNGSWYDGCLGLIYQEGAATEAACRDQCYKDMNCSTWQFIKHAEGVLKCWSGSVMHGCESRGSAAALNSFEDDLIAGERIQHGYIKLVSTNSKLETLGLHHFPETTGDKASQIARCREFCETDATCTVWQYGSNGCWVEHAPFYLATGSTTNSTWAENMVAGETLEHTCPPYVPEEGLPWPWIIAGIVLGLLALGALVYFLSKKPKVKKTRAVKIEPKPEPKVVYTQYFVPQPTVVIPQTSVVQYQQVVQAPTVQYAPTTAVTAPLLTGPTTVIQ